MRVVLLVIGALLVLCSEAAPAVAYSVCAKAACPGTLARQPQLLVRGGTIRAKKKPPRHLSLKRSRFARFRLALASFFKSLFDPTYMLGKETARGSGGGIIVGNGKGQSDSSDFKTSNVQGVKVTTFTASCGAGG